MSRQGWQGCRRRGMSHGGDHGGGIDPIDKRDDQVGGAETHGFSAAEVPGGGGEQVLPRQSASSRARLWLEAGRGQYRPERTSHRDSLPRCFRIAWAAQERRRSAGVSAGDSRAGRTAEPGRPEIPDAAGLHANDGQGGSAAAAGRFQGQRPADSGRADGSRHPQPAGVSAAACPQDPAPKRSAIPTPFSRI